MPNTVFGPYVQTAWVNATTALNQTRMNNLETQASIATHGVNPDVFSAFVFSGIVCTKDGTNANQLDIASGVAYITFTDGTVGRITVVADNTHTTSTPSSTYSLYLQPDGTWFWATSGSPQTNSLFIASVTTDGSGNILVVTDKRTFGPLLAGGLIVAGTTGTSYPFQIQNVQNNVADDFMDWNRLGTTPQEWTWGIDSSGRVYLFNRNNSHMALRTNPTGAFAELNGQATAGNFGVPVVVASALDVHITTNTALQTILSYTPTVAGLYRASASIDSANTFSGAITLQLNPTGPHSAVSTSQYFAVSNGSGVGGLTGSESTGLLGRPVSPMPITFAQAANQAVTVLYTNPIATVSDWVSVIIERLG